MCVQVCVQVRVRGFPDIQGKRPSGKDSVGGVGWGSRGREGKVCCLSVNEKRTFQGLHVEEGPGTGISQYVRVCPFFYSGGSYRLQ